MLQSIVAAKMFSKKLEAIWDNNSFNVFQSKRTPTPHYIRISILLLKQRGYFTRDFQVPCSPIATACTFEFLHNYYPFQTIFLSMYDCQQVIKVIKCQSFKLKSGSTICVLVKYKYTEILYSGAK